MQSSITKSENLLQQIAKGLYNNNVELNKERKRIQEILFQVAETIFSIDQNYKVTVFNASAEITFNISKEEILGKDVDKYINLLSIDNKTKINIRAFAFKSKNNMPEYINEPICIINEVGEPTYFKLRFNNIIVNSDTKECVISLSDITTEVELDNQKDEFISIASHELKTPVTIVKTNLWMFEHTMQNKIDENQKHLLKETQTGVKRLSRIVGNLLDISRLENGDLVVNPKTGDLNKIIKDVIGEFDEIAIKKDIKLLFKESKTKEIFTDIDRLNEVLDNLVSNAIKYTKKGSITISVSENKKFIKFSVKDTGPGIPEKERSRLFKKFSRASEGLKQQVLGASTGLGLYISKRIIEQMGGKIGFESEVGKGSTFWFTILKKEAK